jgi:hypothetical protein
LIAFASDVTESKGTEIKDGHQGFSNRGGCNRPWTHQLMVRSVAKGTIRCMDAIEKLKMTRYETNKLIDLLMQEDEEEV